MSPNFAAPYGSAMAGAMLSGDRFRRVLPPPSYEEWRRDLALYGNHFYRPQAVMTFKERFLRGSRAMAKSQAYSLYDRSLAVRDSAADILWHSTAPEVVKKRHDEFKEKHAFSYQFLTVAGVDLTIPETLREWYVIHEYGEDPKHAKFFTYHEEAKKLAMAVAEEIRRGPVWNEHGLTLLSAYGRPQNHDEERRKRWNVSSYVCPPIAFSKFNADITAHAMSVLLPNHE